MNAYDQLVKTAKKAGARVELTGSGHWRIRIPNGRIIYASQTPSDSRALANLRAELRRAGILPKRSKRQHLSEVELEFLAQLGEQGVRGDGIIPPRLQGLGLIRVSNRYRHGQPDGWRAWLTEKGQRALEASR